MSLKGIQRPISAQVHIGKENQERLASDDEVQMLEEEEYIDINEDRPLSEDKGTMGAESFSHRILNSRPTTAYKKDRTFELPYPELFDRSERTYAATFAKYGDLSYYTPVQRIGAYMDFNARLKRRHLHDLVAYMKTSKAGVKAKEEEDNKEEAEKDFKESCLFLGVMKEEDAPLEQEEEGKGDEQDGVYDPFIIKFEGEFEYEQVWADPLIKQVELSYTRFAKYVESAEAIKNEEISKFKKDWMQKALDLIPDTLVQRFSTELRQLFQEVFVNYTKAMKVAILDYILRSPDERKRLHILMLPR